MIGVGERRRRDVDERCVHGDRIADAPARHHGPDRVRERGDVGRAVGPPEARDGETVLLTCSGALLTRARARTWHEAGRLDRGGERGPNR